MMSKGLAVSYDPSVDVLYLALGEPVAAYTDEDDAGLLVRTAYDTGEACGITVLGFGSHWARKRERLATLVGHHLHLPDRTVIEALKKLPA